MSVSYFGDFPDNDTVNLPFNTFSSDDPSASVTATQLTDSDIYVHKDGSATPIATDGATIDIDAPGVGAHMVTIDTNADAAYVTGSEYAVRVDGVDVDGGTINAWIGAFSIERAGGALAEINERSRAGPAGVGGGVPVVRQLDGPLSVHHRPWARTSGIPGSRPDRGKQDKRLPVAGLVHCRAHRRSVAIPCNQRCGDRFRTDRAIVKSLFEPVARRNRQYASELCFGTTT